MTKNTDAVTEVGVLSTVLQALKKLKDVKQQNWVIASAVSNLGLTLTGAVTGTVVTGSGAGGGIPSLIAGEPGTKPHARNFLKSKRPVNAMQQVACLAYYLTHHAQMPEFKARDIKKMNVDAGGQRLSNPSQALNNALFKVGYIGTASGGRKVITGLGEDVVNALPDQAAVKALGVKKKGGRKKKSKKA